MGENMNKEENIGSIGHIKGVMAPVPGNTKNMYTPTSASLVVQ